MYTYIIESIQLALVIPLYLPAALSCNMFHSVRSQTLWILFSLSMKLSMYQQLNNPWGGVVAVPIWSWQIRSMCSSCEIPAGLYLPSLLWARQIPKPEVWVHILNIVIHQATWICCFNGSHVDLRIADDLRAGPKPGSILEISLIAKPWYLDKSEARCKMIMDHLFAASGYTYPSEKKSVSWNS